MKQIAAVILSMLLFLSGCGKTTTASEGETAEIVYQQITQEEAKNLMDIMDVVILDVRERDEFDAGHIPGAVLLPVDAITAETASEVIPEEGSVVLVYCRSGNRSKTASERLAELGYSGVHEFGGINTWPYEVE